MDLFKDKVVIVTGAGSGIGKELCEQLSRRGALVVLSDINKESCENTLKSIKAAGGQAWGEKLDVTDYEAFKKHIEDTAAARGRVDYLFNNAGTAVAGELQNLEVEHWKKTIDVNLNGVFYGSLVAYKLMVKQGFGHIVNISSIEGMLPFPGNSPYVATKYAVLGFTQTMWLEAGHFGINVSAVCPGFIRTPIFDTVQMINIDREKALAKQKLFLETLSITPEKCVKIILKGVAKNKPIIPVSGFAHVIWRLSSWMPIIIMKAVRKDFNKWRDSVRIPD